MAGSNSEEASHEAPNERQGREAGTGSMISLVSSASIEKAGFFQAKGQSF
jgi:hypothetical protein